MNVTSTELNPEDVAKLQHQDWLKHPTTIQMLKLIDYHKQAFVDGSANGAGDYEIPDAQFRLNAYAIATLNKLKHCLIVTDIFINNSINQTGRNK